MDGRVKPGHDEIGLLQAAEAVPLRLIVPPFPSRNRIDGARLHRRQAGGFLRNLSARGRHALATQTAGYGPAVFRKYSIADSRSDRSRNPLLQLLLRRGADLARRHFAALEDHQGRDRHHAVFRSRLRALIDVQLHDLDLVAHGAGNLVERRRDHAARAAPFGPEIDHDRADRLEHFGVEIGVRNLANGHWDTSSGWEDAAERIAASIMHSTYERMVAGSSFDIPLDNGCQLRVQRRSRNLHQFRGFGPK